MSSIEKPTPPPIGERFSEKDALSMILARDKEKFLAAGGKIERLPGQNYVPRDRMARSGATNGMSALDQYLMSSEG